MSDRGANRPNPTADQALGHIGQGSGGDREIVDDDSVPPLDVADQVDDPGGLAVVDALLVGDRQWGAEQLGELSRLLRETHIG